MNALARAHTAEARLAQGNKVADWQFQLASCAVGRSEGRGRQVHRNGHWLQAANCRSRIADA
eukprot:3096588-Alexandrium_andersonii.AAC.1